MQNSTAARHKHWLQFYLSELFQRALQMLPHLNKMTRVQCNGIFHWWRDSSPETSGFSNILALRTQRQVLIVINQFECLVIEITRLHSRPFLVSSWYRPPSSSHDNFSRFEILVDKIDSENNDFYLLGDLNCDMLHNRSNYHISSNLTNIFDIYGLSQMISEPTRITSTSRTLIDLCITNSPEKIVNSGVVHLGISDHSLVFMTIKIRYERVGTHRTIETRDYKKIDSDKFLNDLVQQPWDLISLEPNPTAMWVGCVENPVAGNCR